MSCRYKFVILALDAVRDTPHYIRYMWPMKVSSHFEGGDYERSWPRARYKSLPMVICLNHKCELFLRQAPSDVASGIVIKQCDAQGDLISRLRPTQLGSITLVLHASVFLVALF